MRMALSIVLAALVWLTSTSNLVKVLVFQWNRQQLEQFCINKAKPEKNCHAHCYLAQRLGKEEPLQPSVPAPDLSEKNFFLISDTTIPFVARLEEATHLCPCGQQSLYPTPFYPEIFHPPARRAPRA